MDITHTNVIDALLYFTPEFEKEITCDRDNFFCILWVDFPYYYKRLIKEGNDAEIAKVFLGINALFKSKDDQIQSALSETIVESLAIYGKEYYEAAKKYMDKESFGLIEHCKNNPPSGIKPLDY